jgi:itaconate CoA-transferase
MLGLQNEREWATFCDQVLQQPALKTDPRFSTGPRRSSARQALYDIIVEAFSHMTAPQVVERLDQAQIGNAAMNDMHQLWEHAQLRARRRWAEVDTPNGKILAMRPPGVPEDFNPRMDPIPAVGEHTDAILGEIGYAESEIARLRSAQVI